MLQYMNLHSAGQYEVHFKYLYFGNLIVIGKKKPSKHFTSHDHLY